MTDGRDTDVYANVDVAPRICAPTPEPHLLPSLGSVGLYEETASSVAKSPSPSAATSNLLDHSDLTFPASDSMADDKPTNGDGDNGGDGCDGGGESGYSSLPFESLTSDGQHDLLYETSPLYTNDPKEETLPQTSTESATLLESKTGASELAASAPGELASSPAKPPASEEAPAPTTKTKAKAPPSSRPTKRARTAASPSKPRAKKTKAPARKAGARAEGTSSAKPKASGGRGKSRKPAQNQSFSWNDILHVQNLIERCMQQYLNKSEIVATLEAQAKVEPSFTAVVWQKLEEQNPAFFRAYSLQLQLKEQITAFNYLVTQQKEMMIKASGNAALTASLCMDARPASRYSASTSIHNTSVMRMVPYQSTPQRRGMATTAFQFSGSSVGTMGSSFAFPPSPLPLPMPSPIKTDLDTHAFFT